MSGGWGDGTAGRDRPGPGHGHGHGHGHGPPQRPGAWQEPGPAHGQVPGQDAWQGPPPGHGTWPGAGAGPAPGFGAGAAPQPPGTAYAAPPSGPAGWPGPAKPPYHVGTAGHWACGLLGMSALLYALVGVLGLLGADAVRGPALGLASLLGPVVLVLFLVWLYRVRHNVEHLDPYRWAGPRRLGTGWAIGSWFVPVGFLWLPLRVVLDVWWGTAQPAPQRGRVSPLLPAWWTCWLLAWFTGAHTVSSTSYADGGARIETYGVRIFLGGTTLSAFVTAVAAVLLLLLIRRVSAAQTARFAGAG